MFVQSMMLADIDSHVHRLDPRARLAACVALALVLAVSHSFLVLCAGLLLGMTSLFAAKIPLARIRGRLLAVNGFVALLLLTAPFNSGGGDLFRVLGQGYGLDGLRACLAVALKANAITLLAIAMVTTIDIAAIGHALARLKAPLKLVWLLLFTVRYIDVVHGESQRLARTMRARGFRARMDLRTCKVYADFVGSLLVRSLDRSERVMAAMKCRCFKGEFHLIDQLAFRRRDLYFSSAVSLLLALLLAGDILL